MNNQEIKMDEVQKAFKKWKKLIFFGVILLTLFIFKPWVQIGPGQRGIVLNFGAVQDKVLDEGMHFRVPVMQQVVLMDVKVQKVQTDASSASSDLQDVTLSVALNYHIIPDKANIVYQKIGVEFKERIIDPAIQEVTKAVSAKYSAEELITSGLR
jgi:regulator of protease activity HflC (stomatin/prohibitin superfamily)